MNSQMMQRNTTLRHLKLRHNGLGNDSAQWLMEALIDGNDHLEILDISWNHFQTRGCVLLADALKVCIWVIHVTEGLVSCMSPTLSGSYTSLKDARCAVWVIHSLRGSWYAVRLGHTCH